MKPAPNLAAFLAAALLSAASARPRRISWRGLHATPDPARQARAEDKRADRNRRRLHLARFRAAFGPEPFARGQEPWL